jgi:hypothetical protein
MIFALSACGSIPAAVETVAETQSDATTGTSEAEATAHESGLGTVAYDEKSRAKACKKVRKTGSYRYITKCDDPDGGSQPVRYGTWNDLGRLTMSGTVRPEN